MLDGICTCYGDRTALLLTLPHLTSPLPSLPPSSLPPSLPLRPPSLPPSPPLSSSVPFCSPIASLPTSLFLSPSFLPGLASFRLASPRQIVSTPLPPPFFYLSFACNFISSCRAPYLCHRFKFTPLPAPPPPPLPLFHASFAQCSFTVQPSDRYELTKARISRFYCPQRIK